MEDIADDNVITFDEIGNHSFAFDGWNSEAGFNVVAWRGEIHQFKTRASQPFGETKGYMKTAAGLGDVGV